MRWTLPSPRGAGGEGAPLPRHPAHQTGAVRNTVRTQA